MQNKCEIRRHVEHSFMVHYIYILSLVQIFELGLKVVKARN